MDRGKIIEEWEAVLSRDPLDAPWDLIEETIELLKEQETVWNVLHDLCELGYPHNFQREAPWVVDYLYELTEIIKKAFKAKEGR